MKRLKFECKLLSDVVLKSTSATEGVSENLDYIPGAKFLGIAAKSLYNPEEKKTISIFHNGDVQFGDAHITIEGKRTIKVPANWFFKKGEGVGNKKYLHHKLTKEIKQNLSVNGIQLKQARKGFFTGNKFINTESNFSIKSAYDSNKRKAEDSKMYGYYALPKGSTWMFSVDTEEQFASDLITALEGRKRIGRSRSAEYGLININYVGEDTVSTTDIKKGEVVIYAESNLCFYDDFSQNTLQPTVEQLGMPKDSEILWCKSQIRTRKYQTWNSKRYNRDADRMIIEKGSVFVVKTSSDIDSTKVINCIGAHKNEGFGKVLLNPYFLQSDSEILNLKLEKYEYNNDASYFVDKGDNDEILINFLKSQEVEKERVLSVDKLVNNFVVRNEHAFAGISASQWGQVRNYAKHAANEKALKDLLFADVVGYFMHGQSEHKWRANNRRWILEEYLFGVNGNGKSIIPQGSKLEFVQKLASEMSKNKKAKK